MIYSCIPESVERIWGSLPPVRALGEPVGEMWWFHENTILIDSAGETVKAVSFFPPGRFPVILKTLHSSRDLSVQVHPGKNGRPPVKDESWAVLEGRGRILHGIREGTSADDFADAVRNGTVENLLERFDASPGDLFHLPAGTLHALGGGLTVLEIQLNCTITYRLWDYRRRDSAGNFRELHVNRGLEAVDWSRWGRALFAADSLETKEYALHRAAGYGTVKLGPMELAYDHSAGKCFFADTRGGECETAGEAWIVRIKK